MVALMCLFTVHIFSNNFVTDVIFIINHAIPWITLTILVTLLENCVGFLSGFRTSDTELNLIVCEMERTKEIPYVVRLLFL